MFVFAVLLSTSLKRLLTGVVQVFHNHVGGRQKEKAGRTRSGGKTPRRQPANAPRNQTNKQVSLYNNPVEALHLTFESVLVRCTRFVGSFHAAFCVVFCWLKAALKPGGHPETDTEVRKVYA